MKIIKSFIFSIVLFLILNIIITIFSYFDLFKDNTINIMKIITFIITYISTGIYLGFNVKNKKIIEGTKLSLLIITSYIILITVFKSLEFNIKQLIYYPSIFILISIGLLLNIKKKKT